VLALTVAYPCKWPNGYGDRVYIHNSFTHGESSELKYITRLLICRPRTPSAGYLQSCRTANAAARRNILAPVDCTLRAGATIDFIARNYMYRAFGAGFAQ
jgi:hypothetical protein